MKRIVIGMGFGILENNINVKIAETSSNNVDLLVYPLINSPISPNEMFKIEGFLQAYKEYKTLISFIKSTIMENIFSKFESQLIPENKLILELELEGIT